MINEYLRSARQGKKAISKKAAGRMQCAVGRSAGRQSAESRSPKPNRDRVVISAYCLLLLLPLFLDVGLWTGFQK